MQCRALSCEKEAGDQIICEYHQEKFRIVNLYTPDIRLLWMGDAIFGVLVDKRDEAQWGDILTLEDLEESLYLSTLGEDNAVMCELIEEFHWFSTPMETKYVRYGTLYNWLQESTNFEEVRKELESLRYFVTNRGGLGHFEKVEVWKNGEWSQENY